MCDPFRIKAVPTCARSRPGEARRRGGFRLGWIAACLAAVLLPGVGAGRAGAPASSDALFAATNVWTVHFKFAPEQWRDMEPQGGGGFLGGPGGPGGPGGRGGPGGPGGPGGFGPGMFLAPVFLKEGDQDRDGKLSRDEFRALGEKWFSDWDKDKTGSLNAEGLRAGLGASVGMPDFGPPGGRGGRGPGLWLQGAEGKRNGLSSAAGIDFKYVHADLDFAGTLLRDVAVRYKGNGTFMQSRGSIKRSLKIDLNKYVKDQKLAGVTRLNLHNNVTDASWMNEVLSHRLFRDAGVPAPRTAYARVFVTVPGEYDRKYFGLYSLVEDVDSRFIEERFGDRKGAIFKPVTPNPFADLGDDWARYNQTYDPKTELTTAQKRRVIDFCGLVTRADDAEFAARLGEYVDLEEFSRFMAVTVWLSTMDSILGPGQNYYVYLDPGTQKFRFMPWDLDHSFGQFGMMGSQEQRERLSLLRPWRGENRFLERVFKTEAFRSLYLARLREFQGTIFRPERFQQQVDEIAAAIRPAVEEESQEMLARFDKVAAGEPVAPSGFGRGFGPPRGDGDGPRPGREGEGGRGFGGPPGFFQPAKPIKGFVTARAQSVADQLAGKSEGETVGEFGFGGPGGGRGGPGRFGPGMFLGNAFMAALDADHDGALTRDEFTRGFGKWFDAWNAGRDGLLTDEQLRAGINRDLGPFRGGPPGAGPGSEPPPGPPRGGP